MIFRLCRRQMSKVLITAVIKLTQRYPQQPDNGRVPKKETVQKTRGIRIIFSPLFISFLGNQGTKKQKRKKKKAAKAKSRKKQKQKNIKKAEEIRKKVEEERVEEGVEKGEEAEGEWLSMRLRC